jgi:hypothetical protein
MMKQRTRLLLHVVKWLLAVSLIVPLLGACAEFSIEHSYPLESVDRSGSGTSYVYRAAGKSVPEVAAELAAERKPDQMSAENPERMFLVYGNEWYHLQQDPEKPEDTLIEVDSEEFVRQNYNPGFLEGYLLASLIGEIFDDVRGYGDYRGYSNRDIYKPKGEYRAPTSAEKKAIPPMTVDRKGTIFKRGKTDPGTSAKVGDGGSAWERGKTSVGKIIRGDSQSKSSKSSPWFSPKKIKPPKTRVGGFGKIMKRR